MRNNYKFLEVMNLKTVEDNHNKLQSVQRGLHILKLFSLAEPVWGITDIADTLHLSKSTVSRLIKDLVEEGYLEKTSSKYRLGLSLLCLSGVITSHLEIYRESKDLIKELVNRLEETAHIAILEEMNVAYLHKVECKQPVPLLTNIGKKNPPTCTGSGKILLAYQTIETVERIINAGLPKMGPNSIIEPQQLLHELETVRAKGYAICIDEMQEGIISIGAPIRDYTNEVVAAINVVGPNDRGMGKDPAPYIRELIKTADEISTKLGYIKQKV